MTDRSVPVDDGATTTGATTTGAARVTFVHGVGGPVPGWDDSLRAALRRRAGAAAPTIASHTLRYDHVFDGQPRPGAPCDTAGAVAGSCDTAVAGAGSCDTARAGAGDSPQVPAETAPDVPPPTTSGEAAQQAFARRREILTQIASAAAREPGGTDGARRLRLPKLLPGPVVVRWPFSGMPHALAYRDDREIREAVHSELYEGLAGGDEQVRVVIAHSLGSVVVLDALLAGAPPVDLLLTIGSPLGVDSAWSAHWDPATQFPHERIGAWLNVVNTRDPIPWNHGVAERFPQALDAFITAGAWPVGPGSAHDPAIYTGSTVVAEAVLAAVAGWPTLKR